MLDLRRLRAFAVLAEEGHVTRAAERLGMAQPPLSRLLKGMEAELGVTLMHRLPRGVRPTAAGEALLAEAQVLLARAARLPETVRRAGRGEEGRLAIGFTSSAALHPFVPAALRAFRNRLPAVALQLEEARTIELVDALRNERLDAAFVRSPVGGQPVLRLEPVLDEPMLAALPAGHPLAAGQGDLALAGLAAEPFILYRRQNGPGLYDAILTACREQGFNPAVAQEAPRLPSTLALVAAGLGVSIVPASMRRLGGEGIVYRGLTGCGGLSAPIHLASRRADPSPTLRHFRRLVRAARAPAAGV